MSSVVSYGLGPVVSTAAWASAGWSGASGGGRWPTSHTRPVPKAMAVPAVRAVFFRNSRRCKYSASGVISLLDGSGANLRTWGVYGLVGRRPHEVARLGVGRVTQGVAGVQLVSATRGARTYAVRVRAGDLRHNASHRAGA